MEQKQVRLRGIASLRSTHCLFRWCRGGESRVTIIELSVTRETSLYPSLVTDNKTFVTRDICFRFSNNFMERKQVRLRGIEPLTLSSVG